MAKINKTKINIAIQAGKLKSYFPDSIVTISPGRLVWKCTIKPTPLSKEYDIKLVYKIGANPNVYIINTKLRMAIGETSLPHVYDTKKQWLCLYYRKANEWNSSMLLSDTIIPWVSEWLYFYEIWVGSGIWYGGGIEHGLRNKISND